MHHHLSILDYAILVIYMIATVTLGLWFTRKQKSVETYFVANRSMKWWAVGISVIASHLSAISYLGGPAWLMEHDLQLDVYVLLAPLMLPIVAHVFLPFLARLRVISIYEYLEHRFGIGVRSFGSALFLLLRGGWIATAIYTQSLLVSTVVPVSMTSCVFIIGTVTALYTVFGGMEAVLWTDFMQFFVLMGGLVTMFIAVVITFHGDVGQMWQIVRDTGHTRAIDFTPSLTGINFWGMLISLVIINTLATNGSDQLVVQRLLTAGGEKEMRRSLYFSGLISIPVVVLLDLVGLALVAFYHTHPEHRAAMGNVDNAVPYFIQQVLPHGMAGLVIAGVFAATMSSLSSGFNSLGTATIVDFYERFRHRAGEKQETHLWAARIATLVWAVGTTIAALFVSRLGTIVQIFMKINGWLTGPILGMFLLGTLARRPNSFGTLVGALLGTAAAGWASATNIHWLWYAPIGCLATMVSGYVLSLFAPVQTDDPRSKYTVWAARRASAAGYSSRQTVGPVVL
jgi:SSS family transporter